MSQENNKSEVARIRAQIAAESDAVWQALHGPAIVAQHQIITAKMERIGMLHEQLQEIDEEATEFLVETLQASADAAKAEKGREVKDGRE